MPINSISNNTVVSTYEIRLERNGLSKDRKKLSQNISDVKNCVTKLNNSITAHKKDITVNQSLLKSLQSVSKKHGENASVRLKNDHFKYGKASNFLKILFMVIVIRLSAKPQLKRSMLKRVQYLPKW